MARDCLRVSSVLCRILLVVTNLAILLSAIILIILGCSFIWGFRLATGILGDQIKAWTASFSSSLQSAGLEIDVLSLIEDVGPVTSGLGVALLLLGIALTIVSCFGCCGACCKVAGCLVTYAILTGLLFLAQLVLVGIWFTDSEVIKVHAKAAMEGSLKEFISFNATNIQSVLQNAVQIFVGCCGVTNGTDFHTIATKWQREMSFTQSGFTLSFNLTYPISCCKFNTSTFDIKERSCLMGAVTTENSNYKNGCYVAIFSFINQYFQINSLFYALVGVLMLQSVLIVAAAVIVFSARNHAQIHPNPVMKEAVRPKQKLPVYTDSKK